MNDHDGRQIILYAAISLAVLVLVTLIVITVVARHQRAEPKQVGALPGAWSPQDTNRIQIVRNPNNTRWYNVEVTDP